MKFVLKKNYSSQRIEISSPQITDVAFSPLAVVVQYRGDTSFKAPVIIAPYCGHMTREQAIEFAKAMSIAALLHELAETTGGVERAYKMHTEVTEALEDTCEAV